MIVGTVAACDLIGCGCLGCAGVVAGVCAFIPLLREIREALGGGTARIGRGLLVICLSTAMLVIATLLGYSLFEEQILAFVAGELVGFIACWACAAAWVMVRKG
ncbi:OPT family oligopeptide transporter [Coriobacterium glomerans PW2]|uniref:OPT family oligopeptide transporter n=2 Tax=Coriobacterium TaxID=33870 RepID=F2NAC4_CORGP|nr:OPT family oligopeptide transporter [Coriobacterium glomerans PW2]